MLKKITSSQHPLVKHFVKLRQNRDYREEQQRIIVEGIKPLKELCAKVKPCMMMAGEEAHLPSSVPEENIVIVPTQILEKVSGMRSPEGMIGEFPMPLQADLKGKRRLVVLDGISDPGNLGTLLRTALALGWEGAFITAGSCDPYNEKALRAARGATFRLPLQVGEKEELTGLVESQGMSVYAADIRGESVFQMPWPLEPFVLVLGNEAHGASLNEFKNVKKILIPMPGPMESLNVAVAGGILMSQLMRSKA